MKTTALIAALLIIGVVIITPAAFADGDGGNQVFFGFTYGSPGSFYGPPSGIYSRPWISWPRGSDGDRYRSYYGHGRGRRYSEYRGDEDQNYYGHRDWGS